MWAASALLRKATAKLRNTEKAKAMIQRARELAAQGRHPQTIEVLLVMEGFAEAPELISLDLAKELEQVAKEARKARQPPPT
jgi:hypothetical protein